MNFHNLIPFWFIMYGSICTPFHLRSCFDLRYYETIAGGAGAGPGWTGRSGVHTHMTNTRITDVEILERRWLAQHLKSAMMVKKSNEITLASSFKDSAREYDPISCSGV